MDAKKSKNLIVEFFKDAKIKEENGVLMISEVKKDFEEFLGKKSPYKLVFDIEKHNKIKDCELIMQGSYFFLAIRDYLKDKGQTSIIKIIASKPSARSTKKGEERGMMQEFTFLTTYHYLNEKKQIISKIVTKEDRAIDIDLKGLKMVNGKKEEIGEVDLEKSYKEAKKKLAAEVKDEIKKIKPRLAEKLERDIKRIKEHYHKQIKEKDEELERCQEKISKLKNKLKNTYYDRDRRTLTMLIRESEERLENLKKKSYKERLKNEEGFHIGDMIEKRSLSVKKELINATIYYYQAK